MLAVAEGARATNGKTDVANGTCQGVTVVWRGHQRLQESAYVLAAYLTAYSAFIGCPHQCYSWAKEAPKQQGSLSREYHCRTNVALHCLYKALDMRDRSRYGKRNKAQLPSLHSELPANELQPFLRPIVDLAQCSNSSHFLYSTKGTIHDPLACTTHQPSATGCALFT